MNKFLLAWKVSTPLLRVTAAVVLLLVVLVVRALLTEQEPPQQAAPSQSPAPARAGSGRDAALNLCRDQIEQAASNRRSVEYHSFSAPPAIKQLPSGEWELFVKFTAANAYGAKQTLIARCTTTTDGARSTGFDTQESR